MYSEKIKASMEAWLRRNDGEPLGTTDEALWAMLLAVHKLMLVGFDRDEILSFVAAHWETTITDADSRIEKLVYANPARRWHMRQSPAADPRPLVPKPMTKGELPGWLCEPAPTAETDITDDNDVNPITGSVKPEEFEIDNENPLWRVLCGLRQELQWLTRQGYEFKRYDMMEAIFLVTEVAAIMRVDLGPLLENIVCQFRCAVEDDIHSKRAKMPDRLVLEPMFSIKNYEGLEIER